MSDQPTDQPTNEPAVPRAPEPQPATPMPPGYGQPPTNPYATTPQAAQTTNPYATQPPAGPYANPYAAPPQNTSAIVLLIASSICGMFLCQFFTLLATIPAIVALVKNTDDPASSGQWTKWGWVTFAVTLVLSLLAWAALIGLMIAVGSSSEWSDPAPTF